MRTLCLSLAAASALVAAYAHAGEPPKEPAKSEAKPKGKARTIEISVTDDGYQPTPIKVKKGEPLRIRITRKTDKTCANELVIKETNINVPLPLNQTVEVSYTPDKAGDVKFGCAMGMMVSGVLLVE
ncbi:MAG: cupredoxin domain-containing protein [Myxococcales bacterium]|nr:cupredoxin domain-containing protein [Myxococcales bacterium]